MFKDFTTVKYNEEQHYSIVLKMWQDYGWDGVEAKYLPTNGVVIYFNNKIITAGFMYTCDNAPIAMLNYVVGNINAEKQVRGVALNLLINTLTDDARKHLGDSGFVFTTIQHKGLENVYKRNGYSVGETKMTSLFKPFDNNFNTDFLIE